MTRQKSQVEKFNAKRAKMNADTNIIKLKEVENNKPENKAKKIVKRYDLSTEDIFAIITRNSIGSFMHMWNNSMENVIRKSMKDEIRQIIREELRDAYRGMLRGMTDVENIISDEIKQVMQEEIRHAASTATLEPEIGKEKTKPVGKVLNNDKTEQLRQMIIEAAYQGHNPRIGSHFKKISPKHSTANQNFNKATKGVKNAWRTFVNEVLEEEGL